MLNVYSKSFLILCISGSLIFLNSPARVLFINSVQAADSPAKSNYLDNLTMTSVSLLATNLKSYKQTSDVGMASTAGGTFIAGDVLSTLQIKEVIKDLTSQITTGVPDKQQVDSIKQLRDSYIATGNASSNKYALQKAAAASFSAAALAAVELAATEAENEKICMKGFEKAESLAESISEKCSELSEDPTKKDEGDKCTEELNACSAKIAADKTALINYKKLRDTPSASIPAHQAVKKLGEAAIAELEVTAETCSNYTKEMAEAENSGDCAEKIDINEENESYGKLDPKSNQDILSSLGVDSKSSAAFINVSGNSISKDLDLNMLIPKHRAIVWGGMQQLAQAAADATAAEIKTIQDNIDKTNNILAKVGELPKGMVVGNASSEVNTNNGYLPWTDQQIKAYFATNPSVEDIKKHAANLTDAQVATAYRIAGNTLPDGVTQTPGLDPKTGLLLDRLIPVGQSGMYPTASTRGGVDGYHPKYPEKGVNESYTYPASGSAEGYWDNSTGKFVRAGNWHDGKFEYLEGKGPSDREMYSGSYKRMDGSSPTASSAKDNTTTGNLNFSPAAPIDWTKATIEQINTQSKAWDKEGMQLSEQAYRAAEAGIPRAQINNWLAQNSQRGRLQVDNAYQFYQEKSDLSIKANLNNNWHHLTDEEMLYNAHAMNPATMSGSNWDNNKLFATLLYPGGMQGSGTTAPTYVPLHPEDITFVGGANGSSKFDASKNGAYIKWANELLASPVQVKQMSEALGKSETQFRKDILASYNGTPPITSAIVSTSKLSGGKTALKANALTATLAKPLPCLTTNCSSVSKKVTPTTIKAHSGYMQTQIKKIAVLGDNLNGAKTITSETLKAANAVSTEQGALRSALKNELKNNNVDFENSSMAFKEKMKAIVKSGLDAKK